MDVKSKQVNPTGIKLYCMSENKEIGRAYLYVLRNDLHERPFGFIEDVFVNDSQRGTGIGSELVGKAIEEARRLGCYKVICNSRNEKQKVHELYERLGFKKHGIEFRIDL